jgi:hypothetical protein
MAARAGQRDQPLVLGAGVALSVLTAALAAKASFVSVG